MSTSEVYGEGLQVDVPGGRGHDAGHDRGRVGRDAGAGSAEGGVPEHAELTAVACLMMLERINYLLSVEVGLPRDEMVDRLSAIIYAAFNSA